MTDTITEPLEPDYEQLARHRVAHELSDLYRGDLARLLDVAEALRDGENLTADEIQELNYALHEAKEAAEDLADAYGVEL